MTCSRKSQKGRVTIPRSISWRREIQRKDTERVTLILAITNLIPAAYAIRNVGLMSSTTEAVHAKNLPRFSTCTSYTNTNIISP